MKKIELNNAVKDTNIIKTICDTMNGNKLFPFMHKGVAYDLDELFQEGYYDVTHDTINKPKSVYNYGTLLVYGKIFVSQIYVPHIKHEGVYRIAVRTSFNSTWSDWFFLQE